MKKLFILALALVSLPLMAQVKVSEKNVNIEGSKNGLEIYIPFGDLDQIEKELKKEMKGWKGSFKGGKTFTVDDGKLKALGENEFDGWGKVEENTEGGCTVSIAIDLGGAFLNSKEHPAKYKAFEVHMKKFGIAAAKEVVSDEVKEEEKNLKNKQGELSDLEKEQSKKEDEIADYEKKIKENQKAIEESKTKQQDKKAEITEQEQKVKEIIKKREAIK